MRNPRSILITGASSGIGAALARHYAAPGVTLALGGRDAARLEAVAGQCRKAGAGANTEIVDVTDAPAVGRWVEAADDASPLDLAIASAGISGGTAGGYESVEQTQAIFAVNLEGVVNTVQPAADRMAARGRGQIALMSSLAGFRGIPGAPAYGASKAAVRSYGEALRGHLHGRGVGVSVVCPGFIRTPMTAVNDFRMPFLMEPERAARIIARGVARNRARIAFPWPMYAAVWLLGALPPGWTDAALRKLPEKR